MDYIYIILITFIAGVIGTGVGGLVGVLLNRDNNKIVSLLLSFAAGVMLSVVCFDLIIDCLECYQNNKISPYLTVLFVSVGYFVIWAFNDLIDKRTNNEVKHIDSSHPKTADDLDELIHMDHYVYHKNSNTNLFIAGLVMMFAIALHNLPEGMVIGTSYSVNYQSIFAGSGFIMAIVIGFHNIPEGMAVSVPLVNGGMSKIKAIILTGLSGLPTVIGAVLGYLLGGLGPLSLLISLGFASGAMLYVIFGELLPESILMYKSKLPALSTFVGILLGFILVNI